MAQQEHFDVVIVGSGFGGSVSAYRLAQAGQRVLVLERGKAYPPGSFPRSPLGLKRNFWDPSRGLHGMFDMWSFRGFDGVVSSGLGGGSLIYANVMLRKDEHWFVQDDRTGGAYESWPVTRADLDPHYDRVEAMMNAQTYPLDHAPYDTTAKTLALRDAAGAVGLEWFLPKLAVTFANDGRPPVPGEPILEARPNIHGRTRDTCRLCGECDVGCNYGSKNTLDYTYLTAAHYAGAEIRTHSEARELTPLDGGRWSVTYVTHSEPDTPVAEIDTDALPRTTILADRVVLSAGTFGTTHLLMRNRAALPGLSATLGEGFSGNGDLLTFALDCAQTGPDGRRMVRDIEPGRGPVITCAVRSGDQHDDDGSSGRGFYVEDAGNPQFASWMVEVLSDGRGVLDEAGAAISRAAHNIFRHAPENLGDEVSQLLGDCQASAGMLPLLAMGRDVPDGKMYLDGDLLQIDWSKDGGSRGYFDHVNDVCRQLAQQLGGKFMDNPLWWLKRVITVHPLGGARMGASDAEGVVDQWGRVFNHPGLHIADGSVMPGSVGANPSLTIAALADRFCDAIIDGTPPPRRAAAGVGSGAGSGAGAGAGAAVGVAAGELPAAPVSLCFTESMKGFFSEGEQDFDSGYRAGRGADRSLMFHLTITADDVERFIADPSHEALAAGWISGSAYGDRLVVADGQFNLFVTEDATTKRMFYRLPFTDDAGRALTMTGFKEVRHGRGLDLWHDTTTLFTRVLDGHVSAQQESAAEVLASGILHIHPLDFAHQLATFRVDPAEKVGSLVRFGELFGGELWDVYRPGGAGSTATVASPA